MHHYKHVFHFIRHIVWSLMFFGVLSIAVGVLILIYPAFLVILVAALFIVIGVSCLALAIRMNRYSKVEIDL